jgi:PAT family beta-lactamase induction signal transducer AmpG
MSAATARVGSAYLGLFAALYALQGVVVAYFFNFNQPYMESAGVPAVTVGWVQSLAMVPFALKFLAGPLSDRVSLLGWGRRRPYIVLGLVLESLGLLGLSLVDAGRCLHVFVGLAIVAVSGVAIYDTCCDGMVIDVTPSDDRARVQAVITAARCVATTIFSSGFGLFLMTSRGGFGRGHLLLGFCAGLGALPLAWTLAVSEPAPPKEVKAFRWSAAIACLIRPWSLVLIAFGALYSTVAFGVEINLSPFYLVQGFGPNTVGSLAAIRYLGRAIGAGLLAVALPKLGLSGVLTVGVLGLAGTTLGQGAVVGPGSAAFWAFAFGAANGWDDALFCILAMGATDPRLAASSYALLMAITNLGSLGGGLFASLVVMVGSRYGRAFAAAALTASLALLFVPVLGRPAQKVEHRDELDG